MIYGLGARYGGAWLSEDFVNAGVACVGFEESDAPEVHYQLRGIRNGDIIYLKSFGPSSKDLCIMAVGIVTNDDVVRKSAELGHGVNVKWTFRGEYYLEDEEDISAFDKHRNCRTGTLYQEFNPKIQKVIIDMLLNPKDYMDEDDDDD